MEAIKETVKEGLRIALFAGAIAVVGYIGQIVAGLEPDTTFYIIGTLVVRLLDKLIHEANNKYKGLAPF